MKPVLLSAGCLLVVLLSGCAQHPIMPPLPETAVNTIAHDATGQLASLYPPAQTHFVLESSGKSLFDAKFRNQLRLSGYALHETEEDSNSHLNSGGKQLSYVLDALNDMSHYGYYRLTLTIGEKQLSRLYDANELTKPNYWSYRQ
ncbi:conjugal transfer protein TrbH [Methyloglobulus morosus KoM1]|uniref:Conjugal transfer protein TrbH n=1 Tax=Methyloglobulus morosus KoM1 TaxID=1116472 RepID=V5DWH6_9GAMM|nr:conjugal transfer protein TrbH [Methyloglobulus morosus]ESS71691.1 conjugal transfer protein TrbH [Methyloglobulus morosus KoM1]